MIHESYTWKRDLKKQRKRIAVKINKKKNEKTLDCLEKGIFYSAFIIRKLMDCTGKVSDEVENYSISTIKYSPLKKIDFLNRWIDSDSHDWENGTKAKTKVRKICNMLIHSLIFTFEYESDDSDIITGFLVSSDYSIDLYHVSISDWLEFIDFVMNDDVVCAEIKYNKEEKHYYAFKKRFYRLR